MKVTAFVLGLAISNADARSPILKKAEIAEDDCVATDTGYYCEGWDEDYGDWSCDIDVNWDDGSYDIECWADNMHCWGDENGYDCEEWMKAPTIEGDGYTCEYDDTGMVCWGYDDEYGNWYCVFDFATEEYACDYGYAAKLKKGGTIEGDDYICEYDDAGMVCWGWDEDYGDWYCVFDFETEEYACDYGFAA